MTKTLDSILYNALVEKSDLTWTTDPDRTDGHQACFSTTHLGYEVSVSYDLKDIMHTTSIVLYKDRELMRAKITHDTRLYDNIQAIREKDRETQVKFFIDSITRK